jgi:hypothetical protein
MRVGVLLAALLCSLVFVACRTVWVHEEATAEKYANDIFFCKYGLERSEWLPPEPEERRTQSERAWALGEPDYSSLGEPREDWKRCMVRLGWRTSAGGRDGLEWQLDSAPVPRRR